MYFDAEELFYEEHSVLTSSGRYYGGTHKVHCTCISMPTVFLILVAVNAHYINYMEHAVVFCMYVFYLATTTHKL